MHEWPLVQDVVKEIIRQSEKHGLERVDGVCLAIGKEEHITPESLELCFRSLAGDTILRETRLETRQAEGRGIVIVSIEGNGADG